RDRIFELMRQVENVGVSACAQRTHGVVLIGLVKAVGGEDRVDSLVIECCFGARESPAVVREKHEGSRVPCGTQQFRQGEHPVEQGLFVHIVCAEGGVAAVAAAPPAVDPVRISRRSTTASSVPVVRWHPLWGFWRSGYSSEP